MSLGIRQREVLDIMHRHGGIFPPHWWLGHDKRRLLERMRERGLVVYTKDEEAQPVYRLADTG